MHPHGFSCWALLAQSPKQAFLLIFIEEKGWSRCTSCVKDVLVIKWVLKAAPYVNVVPITCLFVATKDLHLFREEKRRAMGRCAAAAPISGQTLAVCFLQENIAFMQADGPLGLLPGLPQSDIVWFYRIDDCFYFTPLCEDVLPVVTPLKHLKSLNGFYIWVIFQVNESCCDALFASHYV